ncbi:putative transposase for insertion sequence element IS702 [Frankliniella fusca]|uniref:Transposase for insertion sequence element IS702 n=1 Tax=Frankliniella fusca TaxID=407009 RepID=A0AAE1H9N6_9NEOP|nr:putative transposase for insertion sequence element IS702 [Frankliniella fusca]
MCVCSKHFEENDFKKSLAAVQGTLKKRRLKPTAIPSLHLPKRSADRVVLSPVKRKREARDDRAKKRANLKCLASTSEACVCDNSSETEVAEDGGGGVSTSDGDAGWEDVRTLHTNDEEKLKNVGVQAYLDSPGIFSSVLSSDKKLFSATGIHSIGLLDSLTIAFDKLAPASTFRNFSICTRDRIILTMMKIKLAVSFSSLAALFDLTIQTCCNYFYDTVLVLSRILKCMIVWPDKEKILKNMPKCFRNYKSTRAILDAYEIPVEKPKCIACRIKLYSHYKKNFTAKVMMVCTPSGLVSLCSGAFGGRASDKVVTQATGVYGLCDPGDGLMVDKGFDIDKECQDSLLALIRPPLMRSKTKKFSRAESVQCAKIARARVHVERVIQRVREYHILKFKVPWNICPYLDDIVVIVCALVNLGKPIMANDKY